ncbi:peptidoglycan recognition family protein [Streptomyces sp. NPDC127084]|uniref:peptidoglycan recognition protein family protein n=1 Tax=Streptomyces sp. NPDC127084 TaxID=3347133 RepID=UPI00364AE4E3
MKLVTRAQLGWPASAAPSQATARGTKVHYEGTPVSTGLLTNHAACIAEWKAIRASHLANTAENYSDVAYNYAACLHGYLLEGRGIGKRTGANGNQTLNQQHYAIVGLVGSEGLTQPTDAMLHAIRDGIELLREHGAGDEIKGHRDGYATSCPGGPLYAWVQHGAPRPGSTPEPPKEEVDMTPEQDTRLKYIESKLKDLYDGRAVAPWTYKGKTTPDGKSPETLDAYAYLRTTKVDVDKLESQVAQLTAKVDALELTGLTDAQLIAIADKVADALHARLAD